MMNCSLFPDNPNHCTVIINIRRAFSTLSLVGCIFVIFIIWLFRKYKYFVQRLILALTVAAAMDSISYLMGAIHEEREPICVVQAFWMSFFDWAVLLWVCCIAFNLFMNVIRLRRTENFEKWYHVICWGVSLIMACIPIKQYGPAGAWCWIERGETGLRFGTWYVPLFILIGMLFLVYIYIIVTIQRQVRRWDGTYNPETQRDKERLKEDVRPLKAYPVIYLVLSIFPLVNRIQNAVSNDQAIFALWVLHAISSPLQGFFNSVAFALDKETFSRLNLTQMRIAFQSRRAGRKVQEYPSGGGGGTSDGDMVPIADHAESESE
ncbi:cyclic AMP receptor-like protein A isoform X2 [Sycon ciliatum]|uniref:cyclic AMP receptor-like protein A isoform X2 n=1 Tax=Sycon ciliatum TaxID=27933 RepID=UPI0020ACF215|eukprot:scpid81330/ scgid5911/ Cyclic AMP receptor-like protein A